MGGSRRGRGRRLGPSTFQYGGNGTRRGRRGIVPCFEKGVVTHRLWSADNGRKTTGIRSHEETHSTEEQRRTSRSLTNFAAAAIESESDTADDARLRDESCFFASLISWNDERLKRRGVENRDGSQVKEERS